MPNNDFLAWAIGAGANIEAQATYAADPALQTGETTGKASSSRYNKALRQSTMWAQALGGLLNQFGLSANDDGVPANLTAGLVSALQNLVTGLGNVIPTTGDAKLTFKTSADPGWVLVNDGSIGNAASNATNRNNADTSALFTLMWNNTAAADCPVQDSTGSPVARGASAAADFAANRRLVLPLALGRALVIAGAGSGLSSRALGHAWGTETTSFTLSQANIPNYTLNINSFNATINITQPTINSQNVSVGSWSGAFGTQYLVSSVNNLAGPAAMIPNPTASGASGSISGVSGTVASGGSGSAVTGIPIAQPSTAMNIMIKL